MSDEQVPVLIVGGGGAGLTASMLLARHGVDHLLVSALPGTSDLPKAHVLNQRTMEILEDCGVADEIAERSTPAAQHGRDRLLRRASPATTPTRPADRQARVPGAPAATTSTGARRAPGTS